MYAKVDIIAKTTGLSKDTIRGYCIVFNVYKQKSENVFCSAFTNCIFEITAE